MSGKELNTELVKTARALEMKYFKEYKLYTKVQEREGFRDTTSKGPIGAI